MVNYLHFEPVKAGNNSPNNQKFADKPKLGSGNLNKIKSLLKCKMIQRIGFMKFMKRYRKNRVNARAVRNNGQNFVLRSLLTLRRSLPQSLRHGVSSGSHGSTLTAFPKQ